MPHTTRVLRSEWTKIRSVRSTLWTLASALVVTVGLSAVVCFIAASQFDNLGKREQLSFDATQASFAGAELGQLAMIAFGVLVVSSEYSTGMIRSSLASVPQRTVFLASKIFVATSLVLVVGMATSFSAFFVGQAVLGERGVSIEDEGVLRAVAGGGVYMTLIALFAMGMSFVLRSPLLAFGILMPFFFLISNTLGALSATKDYAQYLPDQAGKTITSVVPESLDRPYGPYEGLLIMGAWVAAALLAGWIVLKRRDA